MTRDRLFAITQANGLTLDVERVTTGPVNGPAFREFEFIHSQYAALQAACNVIRDEWDHSSDFVCVRISDADFKPYLLVSSFWCEPQA